MERTFPLDLVPRLVTALEWEQLSAGLVQNGDIAPIKGLHAGGGASGLDVSVTMVAPSKPVPEEVAVPPRDPRPLTAQQGQQQQ